MRRPMSVLLVLIALFPMACKKSATAPTLPELINTPTFTYTPTATLAGYCGGSFATCTETYSPTVSSTPTETRTPTPTRTPTITPTPTLAGQCGGALGTCTFTRSPTIAPTAPPGAIVWRVAGVARIDPPILDFHELAMVDLRVNGQPESTANVTVVGSNGTTYTLPYNGPVTDSSTVYASYFVTIGFFYVPGVTYTFNTVTSAGAAQASIVAPGNITHASDGSSSSWTVEGNEDEVRVTNPNGSGIFQAGPDANSPVYIPPSVLSACGSNSLTTDCNNHSMTATNATVVSGVWAEQILTSAITVTSNCTVVPTSTQFVWTPVPTNTPTVTATATNTSWPLKTYGGANDEGCNDMVETSDNGFVICGSSKTYGPNIVNAYVLKLSSSGDFSWHNAFASGIASIIEFMSAYSAGGGNAVINVDPSGNNIGGTPLDFFDIFHSICVGGTTGNVPDLKKLGGSDDRIALMNCPCPFIVRIDPDGNTVWAKSINYRPLKMAVDSDDSFVYIANTSTSNADVVMNKMDADGNEVYSRSYGGLLDDRCKAIAKCSDGGYAIAGYSDAPDGLQYNMLLIKTDASGNQSWSKQYGASSSCYGSSVAQTSDGMYMIAGYSTSDNQIIIAKADGSGDQLWFKKLFAIDTGGTIIIRRTSDGNFVLCGTVPVSGYSMNIFVTKIDGNGEVIW